MADLRLGILGFSDGNGHPYSWSAIFNGYSPSVMAECGFPGILAYLANQSFPTDCIPGARVTQVWTQDRTLSCHIADATFIDTVAEVPEQMIGQVDAVLLARDDAENHRALAEPFIAAGLPIYVDKPFAHTRQEAADFFSLETRTAQIFSCSALRFAQELLVPPIEIERIGGITHISAQVPKSWRKYAIHAIDPILVNCGPLENIRDVHTRTFGPEGDGTEVVFSWGDVTKTCEIKAFGCMPSLISVAYVGPRGTITTQFQNSFAAFKSALTAFLRDSVNGQISHAADVLAAIEIVELGT